MEIDALERAGLLTVERGTGVYVVELTRRGTEVAESITAAEGVARVEPGWSY